jgi:hypothetical protein
LGTSGERRANTENKFGVLVSFSIKIDRRISQSYVDGRIMGMESGIERPAADFGDVKREGISSHSPTRFPSSHSIISAFFSSKSFDLNWGRIEVEISCVVCT